MSFRSGAARDITPELVRSQGADDLRPDDTSHRLRSEKPHRESGRRGFDSRHLHRRRTAVLAVGLGRRLHEGQRVDGREGAVVGRPASAATGSNRIGPRNLLDTRAASMTPDLADCLGEGPCVMHRAAMRAAWIRQNQPTSST